MTDTHSYELVFICQPEIGTDELDTLTKKLKDLIQKNDGSVTNEDRWGRKRLAYSIQGHREGFYDLLTFQAPGATIADLEHQLKVSDSVIRHLFIRIEKSGKKPRREKKASSKPARDIVKPAEAQAPSAS